MDIRTHGLKGCLVCGNSEVSVSVINVDGDDDLYLSILCHNCCVEYREPLSIDFYSEHGFRVSSTLADAWNVLKRDSETHSTIEVER